MIVVPAAGRRQAIAAADDGTEHDGVDDALSASTPRVDPRRCSCDAVVTVRPWQILDRVDTPAGPLDLRRRGPRDFLITVAGRVLMTSVAHRSEDALARLACATLKGRPRPRLLLGGLGMGYTLRAALDALPAAAEVRVVELNPRVVDWCRGPLAPLTANAVADRRVTVEVADVAQAIAAAPPGHLDAILLDLYEGPNQATAPAAQALYGDEALARMHAALRPGGVLAVWSEAPDRPFAERCAAAGFTVDRHPGGSGGRAHVVYLCGRAEPAARHIKRRPRAR